MSKLIFAAHVGNGHAVPKMKKSVTKTKGVWFRQASERRNGFLLSAKEDLVYSHIQGTFLAKMIESAVMLEDSRCGSHQVITFIVHYIIITKGAEHPREAT